MLGSDQYIYQISGKGVVRYPLIFSRDENIRRGRRPSWIFLGETRPRRKIVQNSHDPVGLAVKKTHGTYPHRQWYWTLVPSAQQKVKSPDHFYRWQTDLLHLVSQHWSTVELVETTLWYKVDKIRTFYSATWIPHIQSIPKNDLITIIMIIT